MIHNASSYVRDYYHFRRSFYPQLNLTCLDQDEATKKLQETVFNLTFNWIMLKKFCLEFYSASNGNRKDLAGLQLALSRSGQCKFSNFAFKDSYELMFK